MTLEIQTYNQSKPRTAERSAGACTGIFTPHCQTPKSRSGMAHPSGFLEGSPIVEHHSLKKGRHLLFWSGHSFVEPGLKTEGTFKGAGAMYDDENEVNGDEILRWNQKLQVI